ncbi:hypothetical protein TNCV_1168811 [Trichonephila clavipes]|uniref:Uncharacterized protein n=1 Tax=Trichonephila clavipes TaxID=2585209 RepID=A0A8X6SX42_TRICX|nr:hypothetical protein TNCV_1168811 [Trichonephila clavipes]
MSVSSFTPTPLGREDNVDVGQLPRAHALQGASLCGGNWASKLLAVIGITYLVQHTKKGYQLRGNVVGLRLNTNVQPHERRRLHDIPYKV